MKNLKVVLFVLFAVSLFNLETRANVTSKYIGNWTYTCNEAPYPYHEGDLLIVEKDKKTTVKIVFKDGQSITAQNVKMKEDKLTFDIWLEGTTVTTVLEQKDKKIVGKVNSPEGPMTLKVEKKTVKK